MAPVHGLLQRLEQELPLSGLAWDGPFGQRLEAAVLVALTAEGAPQRKNGRMAASLAPGLGIQPRPEFLKKPDVDVS